MVAGLAVHYGRPGTLVMTGHTMSKKDAPTNESPSSTFKTTLIRVFVVQFVALAVLALLQLRYPG